MKIAILCIIVACIASTFCASAPQAVVDWGAVKAKVDEICSSNSITNIINQIKSIANEDNAQVGASIGSQLDNAAVDFFVICEEIRAAVDSQSLTEAEAKEFFTRVKDLFASLQNDLQDELAQLSTGAAGQIRDLFYSLYASVEGIAQQLYALLAGLS